MSRLRDIKAAQIAAAREAGEDDPYQEAAPVEAIDNRTAGRAQAIKALQIAEAEQAGVDHPYLIGFDLASGRDRSVFIPVGTDVGKLEHYQAAMSADLARLAPIKDIVERAKLKASMLSTYWDFVKAYVDNGDHYPNDVAVRVCIWLFDILDIGRAGSLPAAARSPSMDIERALDLALHLIKQGIHVMPDKFDRDLPTFVCDATYDWAAALLKLDPPQSASPYLDTLVATIDNQQWSLAPVVQSKMYAILAKHKNRVGEYATCIALCEKAEAVNPEKHGTKGLKAEAQAKLKLADKTAE